MFGIFKNDKKEVKSAGPKLAIVLDFTVGRDVSLDPLWAKMLPGDTQFSLSGNEFMISAQGVIDFGEQSFGHRFYDDKDEVLFQVLGSEDGSRIDEMKLWSYHSVKYPNDAQWADLKELIKGESYSLETEDGKLLYQREWFADDAGPADPMQYWETVYDAEGGKGRRIYQTAMLFSRELDGGDFEYLLVNLEEPDEGDRSATYMIGVGVTKDDLVG